MTEFRDDWPDEADAIIYCTPQDAVKNMNLGAGIDPTQVRSKNAIVLVGTIRDSYRLLITIL